jgi:GNAT superfamily N-acetyltransferase
VTQTQFEVCKANPADAEDISQLISGLSRFFTVHPEGLGAEAFLQTISAASIRQLIEAPNMAYFKAVRGGRLAGVVAMRDQSHLYHLFVAPAFQGAGLARLLWAHASSHARSNGNAGAFTVNSTPHAVPVYERFGFTATGPRIEKNGIAFVPMRCDTDRSI